MMQPTQKLYNEDVMRKSFCAKVLACESVGDNFRVALTATVFYPEGGGQPADCGALGGARVLDVQEERGVIWHTLTMPVSVGDTVQGDLDWHTRFDRMQQHTGEHIVSGIVHALYGYDNVGFHIGQDAVRLDFSGVLTAVQLADVECAANEVIWQNELVQIAVPRADELAALSYRSKKVLSGEVRIVTAGSADVCACCGTHVRTCAEVGMVKLLSAQGYKGGTRVLMVAGARAWRDYCNKCENVNDISVQLSAKPAEAAAAVRRLAAEHEALKAKAARLETAQLTHLAAQAVQRGETLLLLSEDATADAVRRCCTALCEAWAKNDDVVRKVHSTAPLCAVFAPRVGQGGFFYALAARVGDAREEGAALQKALRGCGGGKPCLIQGSVEASAAEVRAFWNARG